MIVNRMWNLSQSVVKLRYQSHRLRAERLDRPLWCPSGWLLVVPNFQNPTGFQKSHDQIVFQVILRNLTPPTFLTPPHRAWFFADLAWYILRPPPQPSLGKFCWIWIL